MTISQEQVAEATAELENKTPTGRAIPRVSTAGSDAAFLVFTNFTVPAYRLMYIMKNESVGVYKPGEAVVTLQGVNGNGNYELGTGDQYDDLVKRMFK